MTDPGGGQVGIFVICSVDGTMHKMLMQAAIQPHLPSCSNGWDSAFVDGIHICLSQRCQHGTGDDAVVHSLGLGFVEDHLGQLTQPLQLCSGLTSNNKTQNQS